MSGGLIANNWTDLTDGTLNVAITQLENGTSVTNNLPWTGTNANGTSAGSEDCLGWTSRGDGGTANDLGIVGFNSSTTSSWSNDTNTTRNPRSCSLPGRLYCFQQ